jgi:peroxiredoxin
MKHVLNNPKSITAATTMFQKFNADLPVFNEETDVFIFKTVLDSLSATYPESEYLLALKDEISRREAIANLNRKLESIEEQSFPNIIMTDINGEKHSLLDLQGKVILLSFWSTSQTEHKMFNNELLPVYEKYHDNGFEVYQVCLDVDKPTWASTVRSQNLPWISVNDGLGVMSSAISSYVIEYLPTMFIINKEGDIVAKDIFDANYLDGIIKSLI